MKTEIEHFVGKWQGESSVVIEIARIGKKFKVRAYDNDDNEELIVSKLVVKKNNILFETYVPSTGWRTGNCLTLSSKNKMLQELTFWECWKRIS